MGERARLLTFNCYKYPLRLGVNLSLLHDNYGISNESAHFLIDALEDAQLLPKKWTLKKALT